MQPMDKHITHLHGGMKGFAQLYLLKLAWCRLQSHESGEVKFLGYPIHKYWDGYQSGK